jgi:NADH-quinone oxidoreductase subunit N
LVSVLDYPVCILGLTFFLLLLISVYDILCMAFLIMGMSICLYGLFIQNTIFNQISREVCIKYFILSAGSTLLILGGCLYLFYFCGTVNFLYINNFLIYKVLMVENILDLELIKRGILLIFIGFLFKLSIAPAHF